VFAVGDVEVVGTIDGQASGLKEPLGSGRSTVARSIARVAVARDCKAYDGADGA
jgi:hypothetical protein